MKKALLGLLLLFGVVGASIAQDFTIIGDEFEKIADVTDGVSHDFTLHSTFSHQLSGTRTFIWERTENYLSPGWTSAVCDTNRCYLDLVSAQQFAIGPGVESRMDVHIYTNGALGDSSVVTMKLYEEGIPDVFIEQKYKLISSSLTATSEAEGIRNISIYPNPTASYFQIENDKFLIKNLYVYNITGNLVAQYDTTDRNRYDVSELPKGAYFVRMIGEAKTLKTLRLNII